MKYLLCKTCTRRRECVYRRGREHVFRCEEFEGERPSAPRRDPVSERVAAPVC